MAETVFGENYIKSTLKEFCENTNLCGFEAYIVTKETPKLRRMSLDEQINENGDNFRTVLKNLFIDIIKEHYLCAEAQYTDGHQLADNQNKYLYFEQGESFHPFKYLNDTEEIAEFEEEFEKIKKNLDDYTNFLKSVIDVINLSNSRQTPKSVNLFTTNYDLYIEKAVDELTGTNRFVFNDGANGYFKRVLESSNYNRVVSYKGLNDNYISEIPSISLIKPHGSMNWAEENGAIVIKNEVVENPKIVKPTGLEEKDTYLDNHYYEMLRVFQLELDKPQSVLFIIGFSFQDKHIGKMVKRALQNPEILIVNFGHKNSDKNTCLKNLGIDINKVPKNLRIYTPKDFNKEHLSDGLKFELPNLTDIINGASKEDMEYDQSN